MRLKPPIHISHILSKTLIAKFFFEIHLCLNNFVIFAKNCINSVPFLSFYSIKDWYEADSLPQINKIKCFWSNFEFDIKLLLVHFETSFLLKICTNRVKLYSNFSELYIYEKMEPFKQLILKIEWQTLKLCKFVCILWKAN